MAKMDCKQSKIDAIQNARLFAFSVIDSVGTDLNWDDSNDSNEEYETLCHIQCYHIVCHLHHLGTQKERTMRQHTKCCASSQINWIDRCVESSVALTRTHFILIPALNRVLALLDYTSVKCMPSFFVFKHANSRAVSLNQRNFNCSVILFNQRSVSIAAASFTRGSFVQATRK